MRKLITLFMSGLILVGSFFISTQPHCDVYPIQNQTVLSDLAPRLFLSDTTNRERFLAGEIIVAHKAINAFIRNYFDGHSDAKAVDSFSVGDDQFSVFAVPGLLKSTGQMGHVGLGRRAIYIDTDLYNSPSREKILAHEKFEIEKWEELRKKLNLEPAKMRGWIIRNLNAVVPECENVTVRNFGQDTHRNAPPIDDILRANSDKVSIDEYSLIEMILKYDGEGEGGLTTAEIFLSPGNAKDFVIAATASKTWIAEHVPQLLKKKVVSLSMEGNIPEFAAAQYAQEANSKGGLGAYFGDKLEGLADVGIDAMGIQPGYEFAVGEDRRWNKVDYEALVNRGILERVFVGDKAIRVRAWGEDELIRNGVDENPEVTVEVYRVNRGGTWSYLFLSKVFDVLYPSKETYENGEQAYARIRRFTQEVVFGKAAYELMRRLGVRPDILHLNEAHTVVAAAQVRADDEFRNTSIVYTNHTLVRAGLEMFHAGDLRVDIARMRYVLGLPGDRYQHILSEFIRPDGTVDFCYAAWKLADQINAVSDEHAIATIKLFKEMYGDEFNKSVVGILNGSGRSWKSDQLLTAESAGQTLDEEALWNIHEKGKQEAFNEIYDRTGTRLDMAKQTAWAVRRLADYKSQYPMLRFLVHIMTAEKDVTFTRTQLEDIWRNEMPEIWQHYNDTIRTRVLDRLFENGNKAEINGLGMQLVVGAPDPVPDGVEKYWEGEFSRWSGLKSLKGKFVYVAHTNPQFLKMQAIGADICINMPRPLEEACGTSDQRTGLNGGVNIAIRGAGPIEWISDYDEMSGAGSGFLIGSYTSGDPSSLSPEKSLFYHEAPADIFFAARTASRLYGEADKANWKRLMLSSYKSANKYVTAQAMEERYAAKVYVPSIDARETELYGATSAEAQKVLNEITLMFTSAVPTDCSSRFYEIRYNVTRLIECPGAIELIELYVSKLQGRVNIDLCPADIDGLVSVKAYRSRQDKQEIGSARVDVPGDIKGERLHIVRMLNMAFAASNIRAGIRNDERDDFEKAVVEFLKFEYKLIAGHDAPGDNYAEWMLAIPHSTKIDVNDVEKYNRLMLKQLELFA